MPLAALIEEKLHQNHLDVLRGSSSVRDVEGKTGVEEVLKAVIVDVLRNEALLIALFVVPFRLERGIWNGVVQYW